MPFYESPFRSGKSSYNRCGLGIDCNNFENLFVVGSAATRQWFRTWAAGTDSHFASKSLSNEKEERRAKDRRASYQRRSSSVLLEN